MKYLIVVFALFGFSFTSIWQTDYETVKEQARKKHQLILLNFSGSDWCGPCIRMKREIFDSEVFSRMADTSLQLINADFPRQKKHELPKKVTKQNEELADRYNPEGKFPFTILLDCEGKVIKTWDGLPDESAPAFTQQIKAIIDARK